MAEEFLNMIDNNMQTPSSPPKTLPVFDDLEHEWDLLGEEWSLLPISNDGPSYSPFDPYFALMGDDATDSGNRENLEPSIDPGLLNINTVATEETQPQVLQEERGGKRRNPSQLMKLLREAPKATPIKGELGPTTSTVTVPRSTPVKGKFGPMETPIKGSGKITSNFTAPVTTPIKGEKRKFGQTSMVTAPMATPIKRDSTITAPMATPNREGSGIITSNFTAPVTTPIKGEKRKFGQTSMVTAPMATPIKREFVQTTSTITAPMATPNRGNDFLKTLRKKSPRKYAALERRCRTPKYQQDRPLLKEELSALQQMIECMKKDLAQSTILVDFITDYIKKKL